LPDITTRAEFPDKFKPVFEPHRYKVYYGGRGGAKSHSFAKALVIRAASEPTRVLCCREFQKSIRDSVHRLLADQVTLLNLEAFLDVKEASIKGRPGTTAEGSEFIFEGLHHNAASIKSYEQIKIAWCEEAHLISRTSWEILIPTIRADDSEIWISFNPELESDETYKRFVLNPPDDAVVVKVNWSDNPWFPEVLRREMLELKRRDPDAWLCIWEGHCRKNVEGAIFAEELRLAQAEGRITKVPWDPQFPVDTFWDLGFADFTSIWFVQPVGMEYRIIDFHQDHLQSISSYLKAIQSKKYTYRVHHLPHDAHAKTLAAGGRSIDMQVRAAGFRTKVLERVTSKPLGIAAARAVFPTCYFDEGRCADGLQALRHYKFEYDQDTRTYSEKPAHDWASHASDAFLALGCSAMPENKKNSGFVGFSNIADRARRPRDDRYREEYAA
jgi:phage terminase large subunit